jgi:hypothetical protein
MMILRSILLLAAAATLSNCCLTPSGCSGPVAMTTAPVSTTPMSATPTPVAAAPEWDGLGEPSVGDAAEIDVTPPKKHARRKTDAGIDAMSAQSSSGARANMGWEDQQAADSADDARLKQKLIICKNCAATQ